MTAQLAETLIEQIKAGNLFVEKGYTRVPPGFFGGVMVEVPIIYAKEPAVKILLEADVNTAGIYTAKGGDIAYALAISARSLAEVLGDHKQTVFEALGYDEAFVTAEISRQVAEAKAAEAGTLSAAQRKTLRTLTKERQLIEDRGNIIAKSDKARSFLDEIGVFHSSTSMPEGEALVAPDQLRAKAGPEFFDSVFPPKQIA